MGSKSIDGASSVTVIASKDTAIRKADAELLGSNAKAVDDRFGGLYASTSKSRVIRPPYDPSILEGLVQSNNTLNQCITAMEVNIDGTGYDLYSNDEVPKKLSNTDLDGFFAEPYPQTSMLTIRRALRRDIETTGNGYLEIIRNATGTIVMLNNIPSTTMRLGALSSPVPAEKSLIRNGKKVTLTVTLRERTFVQMVNKSAVYFKEYGSSRHMNKATGEWSEAKVAAKDRATEILHFTAVKDGTSPYGVPRWINQVPSVLGSRKAEEHNLEFFNSGGLPPVLVTISGGRMIADTKKALESYLNGTGGSQHRAAILEAYSSGTSLDSAGSVRIGVERFGAERQNDSMFENYDTKCEERIRASFRLPELYVGRNSGNFATSRASSMLAESQVFNPERGEFDEVINLTIMKELADGKYSYASRKNIPKDGTLQMKGIAVARSTGAVNPKNIVETISEVAGLKLEFDADQLAQTVEKNKTSALDAMAGLNSLDAGKGQDTPKPDAAIKKMDKSTLAKEWGDLALDESTLDLAEQVELRGIVEGNGLVDDAEFRGQIASHVFPDNQDDLEGAADIACILASVASA